MKLRFEPALLAERVDFLVCAEEFFFLSAFDGDAFDVVGIINVKDANILHAATADARKHACLVAADESVGIRH